MKNIITLILAAFMTMSFAAVSAGAADHSVNKEIAQNKAKKQKGEIKEVTFKVHLHCDKCVAKIMDNLSRVKGVKDLHVCLEDQIVALKYDASKTSEDVLKKEIERLGYEVHGKAEHHHGHNHN